MVCVAAALCTNDFIICTGSKSVYSNIRGEYWGELGWFRIKRGENLLLIESKCYFGVPGNWTMEPTFVANHRFFDDGEHIAIA